MSPMKRLRIQAKNPPIDIRVRMGDGPATITSGLGGWTTVERADDISATVWEGQEPLQQDVPILLDGWADGDSVERELNSIFKLGRDARGDENIPPVFTLEGPIHFDNLAWVLPDGGIDLDPDSTIRLGDGTLVRQALTLHLLEYIKPDQVRLRHKKKKGKRGEPGRTGGTAFPGDTYVTQGRESLNEIAAKLYGDRSEWKAIGKLNDIRDPNRQLPPKTKLKLP